MDTFVCQLIVTILLVGLALPFFVIVTILLIVSHDLLVSEDKKWIR